MHRQFALALALPLALAAAPIVAQTPASVSGYGSACETIGTSPLPSMGLLPLGRPQLGSTFMVRLSQYPQTQLPCYPIHAAIVAGFRQQSVAFGRCTILVTDDIVFTGWTATISVPNQAGLIGLQFYLQGAVFSPSCSMCIPSFCPGTFSNFWFTQGLQCTVGI